MKFRCYRYKSKKHMLTHMVAENFTHNTRQVLEKLFHKKKQADSKLIIQRGKSLFDVKFKTSLMLPTLLVMAACRTLDNSFLGSPVLVKTFDGSQCLSLDENNSTPRLSSLNSLCGNRGSVVLDPYNESKFRMLVNGKPVCVGDNNALNVCSSQTNLWKAKLLPNSNILFYTRLPNSKNTRFCLTKDPVLKVAECVIDNLNQLFKLDKFVAGEDCDFDNSDSVSDVIEDALKSSRKPSAQLVSVPPGYKLVQIPDSGASNCLVPKSQGGFVDSNGLVRLTEFNQGSFPKRDDAQPNNCLNTRLVRDLNGRTFLVNDSVPSTSYGTNLLPSAVDCSLFGRSSSSLGRFVPNSEKSTNSIVVIDRPSNSLVNRAFDDANRLSNSLIPSKMCILRDNRAPIDPETRMIVTNGANNKMVLSNDGSNKILLSNANILIPNTDIMIEQPAVKPSVVCEEENSTKEILDELAENTGSSVDDSVGNALKKEIDSITPKYAQMRNIPEAESVKENVADICDTDETPNEGQNATNGGVECAITNPDSPEQAQDEIVPPATIIATAMVKIPAQNIYYKTLARFEPEINKIQLFSDTEPDTKIIVEEDQPQKIAPSVQISNQDALKTVTPPVVPPLPVSNPAPVPQPVAQQPMGFQIPPIKTEDGLVPDPRCTPKGSEPNLAPLKFNCSTQNANKTPVNYLPGASTQYTAQSAFGGVNNANGTLPPTSSSILCPPNTTPLSTLPTQFASSLPFNTATYNTSPLPINSPMICSPLGSKQSTTQEQAAQYTVFLQYMQQKKQKAEADLKKQECLLALQKQNAQNPWSLNNTNLDKIATNKPLHCIIKDSAQNSDSPKIVVKIPQENKKCIIVPSDLGSKNKGVIVAKNEKGIVITNDPRALQAQTVCTPVPQNNAEIAAKCLEKQNGNPLGPFNNGTVCIPNQANMQKNPIQNTTNPYYIPNSSNQQKSQICIPTNNPNMSPANNPNVPPANNPNVPPQNMQSTNYQNQNDPNIHGTNNPNHVLCDFDMTPELIRLDKAIKECKKDEIDPETCEVLDANPLKIGKATVMYNKDTPVFTPPLIPKQEADKILNTDKKEIKTNIVPESVTIHSAHPVVFQNKPEDDLMCNSTDPNQKPFCVSPGETVYNKNSIINENNDLNNGANMNNVYVCNPIQNMGNAQGNMNNAPAPYANTMQNAAFGFNASTSLSQDPKCIPQLTNNSQTTDDLCAFTKQDNSVNPLCIMPNFISSSPFTNAQSDVKCLQKQPPTIFDLINNSNISNGLSNPDMKCYDTSMQNKMANCELKDDIDDNSLLEIFNKAYSKKKCDLIANKCEVK